MKQTLREKTLKLVSMENNFQKFLEVIFGLWKALCGKYDSLHKPQFFFHYLFGMKDCLVQL